MRITTFLIATTLGIGAYAAEQPKDLAPVPPPPPLEADETPPEQLEPKVTITRQQDLTIEEYRVGGRLYMIKVIPKHGKPYYLVDDRGDGKFARQESLDSGVRPPRWVLKRF